MRRPWILLLSLLLINCSDKADLPEGILQPQKMQEVFWDYIRADVYANEFIRNDSSRNAITENLRMQDKVFRLHKTTREQFYKSYTYYSNHRDLMNAVLDSMISKNERQKKKVDIKAIKPIN